MLGTVKPPPRIEGMLHRDLRFCETPCLHKKEGKIVFTGTGKRLIFTEHA